MATVSCGKLPNQPGISGSQRQLPQKERPWGSFEGRVGKGIESRGKSRGKVREVWKSRMRSGNCKECSLARALSQGMRPAGSGPHGTLRAMRWHLHLNRTASTLQLLAGAEQRRWNGEAVVPHGSCVLLQPLIGPSHPRFYRQRFKSEDAPKVHVALSISLFLLNLAFFINVGHGREPSDATCWARGAIFHYFLLCTFTWMGLEAFHLYLLVIKVFNTYFGHYFLKLSLVGWGRCSSDRQ